MAVVIALSVRLVSLTADRDVQKANAANCTKQMEELKVAYDKQYAELKESYQRQLQQAKENSDKQIEALKEMNKEQV